MAFVSPGAYAREIDLSLYAETLSNTIFGLVGTFNKGPINTPTLVTNVGNLVSLFGEPIDATLDSAAAQGWFAAREYLRKGNQLYIDRVESAATPAEYAAQSVYGSDDDTIVSGTDGVTSIPATRTLTSATGDFVNDGVLVGDVLEISEGGADDGFYLLTNVAATVLTVDRDWPTGSLSAQDFTVWAAKKEAGTDGVTSAAGVREFTSAGSTFQTNGVAAGDILSIEEPSGDIEDNGFYLITGLKSGSEETVIEIDRDWPEGGLTALDFTVYSNCSRGTDGSTATDGEFASAGAKFQDHGVQAGDILYINDPVDTGDNGYYLITGLKTGSEDTTLEVNEGVWSTGSLTGLTYYVLPGSVTYQSLTKGTAQSGEQLLVHRNVGDKDNWDIETKDANGVFSLERVYNMDRSDTVTTMTDDSSYWSATVRTGRGEPVPGQSIVVSGGDDGYTGIVDSDFIGTAAANSGLQSLRNAERWDVNIVAVPGQSSQNVQDAIISLCETRGDCFGLIDPPDWSSVDTVQEIIDFSNGNNIRTTALNTSYAALYWTWQQVYDEYHDQDVWTAPSGHIAGVFANNDNLQGPWFAPAGLKRGKVTGSSDLRYSPDQDDRDSLLGSGQNVNPIVNFVGEGIYVWGQKTLLRTTSALDRVNVRRMLLYLKKAIATVARVLVFDPGDEALGREFKQLAEPVLRNVLSKRGIREFSILDATTDDDRDQNKAVFRMFVKPTKAAEVIELQFVITSQGTDFQELLAAA